MNKEENPEIDSGAPGTHVGTVTYKISTERNFLVTALTQPTSHRKKPKLDPLLKLYITVHPTERALPR